MKDSGEKARWEEIAKEAAKNVLTQFSIGHYEHNCDFSRAYRSNKTLGITQSRGS